MISKFRAAGSGLSAGAMTMRSDDQRFTNVGKKDGAYRLQRGRAGGIHCSVNPFEKIEVHAIVMIYDPLVKFSWEVIGENFDLPSTSPLSWALDADGLDMGSWA